MTTTHVMLDIETLSKSANACIISIGAVAFDPNSPTTSERFYQSIDPAGQVERFHRVIDGDTVRWWMRQSAEAREVFAGDVLDLPSVLLGFGMWMDALPSEDVAVWGNGCMFDNLIVQNAYDACGMARSPKWTYKSDRDYRTMRHFAGIPAFEDHGVFHNALDDAIAQAKHLQAIVAALGVTL